MQVNVARCAFLEQGTVQLLTLDVIITFMQGEMIPFRGIPHPNCAYHQWWSQEVFTESQC